MEKYHAAIYVRISKEDGNQESNSIANQKELIKEFLKTKEDIFLYSEKVDDGYSGANFQRPGFMEMLEEIKEGKINCVIVKDLSRFGRNYIEAGRYIEKIFPFLGVRFIAINDNYDSEYSNTGVSDILIPFKNLVNDAYCKDISIKIRSQLNIKRRKGEFIGAFSPYGYKKSNKNKNVLIIDEYPAEVVKDIFKWKIQGLSYQKIADKLNLYGILSPAEYKNYRGFNYKTSFKENLKAKWSSMAVSRILKNEVYIGNLIQGKETKLNYRTKRKKRIPEDSWIRAIGTHKAIISDEIFNLTKKIMKMDIRRRNEDKSFYLGLLFCNECKETMIHKVTFYKCNHHKIKEEQLNSAVFTLFSLYLQLIGLPQMSAKKSGRIEIYIKEKWEELQHYENRQKELEKDFIGTLINEEEYLDLENFYERKAIDVKESLKVLKDNKEKQKGKQIKLDRGVISFFIDSILIYEDNRIEIKLGE